MAQPTSYCEYVSDLPLDNVHRIYHDTEYGFPIESDNELFGRLILEINQAGLSWTTILNKKDNFRNAYSNFNIAEVANYSEQDRERLLNDAGIIRNKLKVNAAIHNAQQIQSLQNSHGSFKNWLDQHRGLPNQFEGRVLYFSESVLVLSDPQRGRVKFLWKYQCFVKRHECHVS